MYDPYEAPEQTPVLWYLALRAADLFQMENGRYAGEEDHEVCHSSVETHIAVSIDSVGFADSAVFFVGGEMLSEPVCRNRVSKKGTTRPIEFVTRGEEIALGSAVASAICPRLRLM